MNERELFKIEARKLGVDVSECETPMGIQFKYGNTRDMYLLWQASTSREGYKLVPVELTNKMAYAAKSIDGRLSAFKYGDVYKAMINAAD